MGKTVSLLVPTNKPKSAEAVAPAATANVTGKVVGFLWNSKANGDILLLRIKERLSERFQLSGTIWHEKPGTGAPATAGALADLAAASLVVNATCD